MGITVDPPFRTRWNILFDRSRAASPARNQAEPKAIHLTYLHTQVKSATGKVETMGWQSAHETLESREYQCSTWVVIHLRA